LSLGAGGANAVGALVVFLFVAFVVPTPTPGRDDITRANVILFLVFYPVAMTAGAMFSRRELAPIARWMRAERAPTATEVALVLRQPLRQALASARIWIAGSLVFGAFNARYSLGTAAEVFALSILGGIVTCSMCYLLVERILRPVTARALAWSQPARPEIPGVTTRLVLAWTFSTGVLLLAVALVSVVVLAGTPTSADRLAATILALVLIALAAGLEAIRRAARSVADPIESVREALAEVEAGRVEVETPVYDGSEVGLLQAGFNRMAAGLRERERLRDLFGRHVGEAVARQALERGVELGGEVRDVAVLFVDLVGSTRMAAEHEAPEVVAVLNRFFAVVVETVSRHGGWVNKFEGDAALCVFGAPAPHEDAAAAALRAARDMRDRLREEVPEVDAGIGLSAGPVVAGTIGAAERFEYTVVGDPVNEAARLTELAKATPDRILASDAIVDRAGDPEAERWRLGESVTLRGRVEPTRLATPAA
jgi:adenylate cyclase